MRPIITCPSCGSPHIQRVQKDFTDEFQGQTYIVPMLEFYECPDCGERLYDQEAMRKIETYSPAFTTKSTRPKRLSRKRTKQLVKLG